MVHEQHTLEALLAQALGQQDEEHQVSFMQKWDRGVFVQVMAITDVMAVWTIGEMLPGQFPTVTNDLRSAIAAYDALLLLREVEW